MNLLMWKKKVMSQVTFDIELALLRPTALLSEIEDALKKSHELERREKQGWGLVIRSPTNSDKSLADQIDLFLSSLSKYEESLRRCEPVLRLAIFNPKATCTVTLSRLEKISALGAQLEISVYPASE